MIFRGRLYYSLATGRQNPENLTSNSKSMQKDRLRTRFWGLDSTILTQKWLTYFFNAIFLSDHGVIGFLQVFVIPRVVFLNFMVWVRGFLTSDSHSACRTVPGKILRWFCWNRRDFECTDMFEQVVCMSLDKGLLASNRFLTGLKSLQ